MAQQFWWDSYLSMNYFEYHNSYEKLVLEIIYLYNFSLKPLY